MASLWQVAKTFFLLITKINSSSSFDRLDNNNEFIINAQLLDLVNNDVLLLSNNDLTDNLIYVKIFDKNNLSPYYDGVNEIDIKEILLDIIGSYVIVGLKLIIKRDKDENPKKFYNLLSFDLAITS
jgi:hypothetical protein